MHFDAFMEGVGGGALWKSFECCLSSVTSYAHHFVLQFSKWFCTRRFVNNFGIEMNLELCLKHFVHTARFSCTNKFPVLSVTVHYLAMNFVFVKVFLFLFRNYCSSGICLYFIYSLKWLHHSNAMPCNVSQGFEGASTLIFERVRAFCHLSTLRFIRKLFSSMIERLFHSCHLSSSLSDGFHVLTIPFRSFTLSFLPFGFRRN